MYNRDWDVNCNTGHDRIPLALPIATAERSLKDDSQDLSGADIDNGKFKDEESSW